ncbi:MAG: iron donor protein CyaY [Myxococcaceae bacterium]|nr:iron donor protein CyaY [Myxococcaceae bacterium]
MLEESTYNAMAAQVFKRLLKGLDAADPDVVDVESTGEMVTVTQLKTAEKIIINTQRAARQIWVAGKGAGIHFSCDGQGRWFDDKGKGLELFDWVASCLEALTGQRSAL